MAISKWKKQRFIYLLKYFGTGVVLLAVLGVCLFDFNVFDNLSIGVVLLSVDVVFLAWLIVAVFGRISHNKYVLIAFLSFLLLFGICIYGSDGSLETTSDFDGNTTRVLYPVVNTLSIFFPSRGDYNSEESHSCLYYTLHFLGYFFAVWVLFSLFGKQMISRSLCLIIGRDRKNVFWGYSLDGKVLAKDMIEKSEFCQPVFVLPKKTEYVKDEEARIIDELMAFGAIVVNEDLDGRLKIDGVRHFFMSEKQDDNVSLALRMIDQLENKSPMNGGKTYLHVRTEIEGIDALFQAKYDSNENLKKKVEVNLYSQSDLAARSFVMNHPLLDLAKRKFKPLDRRMKIHPETASVSGDCHVLLLGLGWSGYEILKKTVCDAQFLGEDFHFSVTVIDENFEKERGRYLRIFENARRLGIEINVNPAIFFNKKGEIVNEDRSGLMGNVEYHGFDKRNICSVNGCDFYRWLEYNDNILDFDRIIVSLGDDELNTNTAMQLHRFRLGFLTAENAKDESYMPEKILVHVKDYQSYDFYNKKGSPIEHFGDFVEINSVDALVMETMDRVAKAVNYVYSRYDSPQVTAKQLDDHKAVEAAWDKEDTNMFNQNSSRSVALNVNNTVTIAGGIDMFRTRVADSFFLEKCAEMEHKRWNAFNVMSGVDVWDRDDVTVQNGKLKFNGVLARHICIVGFDELDEASLKVRSLGNVNENYKGTDMRIVRHFPLFYDILKSNN